jgi:hypothetical protein
MFGERESRVRRSGSIAVAVVAAFAFAGAPCFGKHATKPMPHVTVTGRVLIGSAKSFVRVGTVDRAELFKLVPAYRDLQRSGISRDSADYHFHLYQANRQFQQALTRAAAATGVDLVIESGGVRAAGIEVVDLTPRTRAELGLPPAGVTR